MSESTALAEVLPPTSPAAFGSAGAFQSAMEMAKSLSRSRLVPKEYQGKPDDCLIALEISQRLGASPLMIMQSLDIIHGRPSWRSQFVIAGINRHPRFRGPLQWRETGKRGTDTWGMVAWSVERETGEIVEGPEIAIQTAKDEGWYGRSGSKWKTLPELMLRYRSASWFASLHCPEIKLGIMTAEEAYDVFESEGVTVQRPRRRSQAQPVRDVEPEALEENLDSAPAPDEPEKAGGTTSESAAEAKPQTRKAAAKPAADPNAPTVDDLVLDAAKAKDFDAINDVLACTGHLASADTRRVRDACKSRAQELREGS